MARKSPRSRSRAKPNARVPSPRRAPKSPATRRARTGAQASRPSGARRTHAGTTRRRTAAKRRVAIRPRHAKPPDPERVRALVELLERGYPHATTALNHENALQLLIATILSAQCTDERVNKVTPGLFARYPDAAAFAAVPQAELEVAIRSTGFYRNKARAIRECCADIVQKFGGMVPRTMPELLTLRGVGRKTANVVLGNAFGIPGIVVDTHVHRLSHRLGLTRENDPVKIEFALMEIIPKEKWTLFSHWLILHGRQVCIARKPRCSICNLAPHCPRIGVTKSE